MPDGETSFLYFAVSLPDFAGATKNGRQKISQLEMAGETLDL
jgi:hypothetical protein